MKWLRLRYLCSVYFRNKIMAEPATKKVRLDEDIPVVSDSVSTESEVGPLEESKPSESEDLSETKEAVHFKETDVGILVYISDLPGFQGIIKRRYADFIVNEVDENGQVVHLTNTPSKSNPEKHSESQMAEKKEEDGESKAEVTPTPVVCDALPDSDVEKLNQLVLSKDKSHTVILEAAADDKGKRCTIHQAIRMSFSNLDSSTIELDGKKVIQVKKQSKNKKDKSKGGFNRKRWPAEKGNYCRFVMYKENRDTMDAVLKLSKMLHVHRGLFQYGGTKDRRAKTTQEITAHRVSIEKLEAISPILWNMRLGNFRYVNEPLRLGQISGNRFSVVLRNVTGSDEVINRSMTSLKDYGFINYFGMQRFGTMTVPTYHVGRAVIKSNWEEVVELIMMSRTGGDSIIAESRKKWLETRDGSDALKTFPKYYNIERTILTGLRKDAKNYCNAFEMLARNTRLMYPHSYQSYIWNCIVSKRIQKFGIRPILGDLVLPPQSADVEESQMKETEEEDEGLTDMIGRLKPIVLDQTNIDEYTIYDVVMTIPGFDVIYPENEVKDWYIKLLQEDGLNLDSFKHRIKIYSLPGTYRKMVVKPDDVSWQTYMYNDMTIPLVLSDMDRLDGKPEPQSLEGGTLKALKIEFTLPSSCYATMALREILKTDTSPAHQVTLHVEDS